MLLRLDIKNNLYFDFEQSAYIRLLQLPNEVVGLSV